MARKMALVPPELVSEYYQINKPEIRLEDSMLNLLQRNDLSDDFKAKLLSQIIPKYQRAMRPPPPKTFEIPPELLSDLESTQKEQTIQQEIPSVKDMLRKYLEYAVPKTRKKYIAPILRRLDDAQYSFNDQSELVANNKVVYRSNAIDLFGYLMRNLTTNELAPRGFDIFLRALYDANIPQDWIGNKKVRNELTQIEESGRKIELSPKNSTDRLFSAEQNIKRIKLTPENNDLTTWKDIATQHTSKWQTWTA